MTSIPSVGSLSGTQLSTLKPCSTGDDGHAKGFRRHPGTGVSGVTGTGTLDDVEPKVRSRRLIIEYFFASHKDGLVGEGGGFDGGRRGLVGQDIGPQRSEDKSSTRQ